MGCIYRRKIMLTDKERKYQAELARYLNDKKRAAKNRQVVRSGDVPCYLSGMTEDKKADMGFHYCANAARINQLKSEIKRAKMSKPATVIRIVK
jgi:hypothetical protein